MSIITVPHHTLRTVAQPIATVDKKILQLLKELEKTLRAQSDPPGVGLAAPQIDVSKRVFATYLPQDQQAEDAPSFMRMYLNPTITDHDEKLSFGPDVENPVLEGCLSIPELYGPVPRWAHIKLKFSEVINNELVEKEEVFEDFHARVIQHEFDHLNGMLFTDYSLQYDLPVYKSDNKRRNGKMVEIDKRILESF